jgi:uncharacterized protein YkwD
MRGFLVAVVLLMLAAPALASEITAQSVIASMNAYRVKKGLRTLREERRLTKAANDRIEDMEEREYWAHESPDGRSPFVWLQSAGYDYRFAGENLAVGFETVELLVESWMESPGHRANILSPLFEDCGVAVIDGSTRGRATGRSVVVLFGRARIAEPAAQK